MIQSLYERLEFMNRNLLILTIRQTLGMFCRRMVISYASLYILAVGGDTSQIGIINSLRPLAGLLMFPISGYITDSSGRIQLIALAGYLSASSMLLYIFAPSWQWIALAALIEGFMVFQFPPTSAITVDSLEPRYRGIGIATMNTFANAFAFISPYVAGIIIEYYGVNSGMRILYSTLLISQIIGATLVLKYLRDTVTHKKADTKLNVLTVLKESYTGIPKLLNNLPRSVKALGLLVGMGFIANGIASSFWVVYVTEEIGLSTIDWGLILLFESVFRTILMIPLGVIADKYGKTKTLFAAMMMSLISLPTLILAKTFTHVLLIRLCAGLAVALFIPSSIALMADYVPRNLRGRVMAAIGRGSLLIGATGGGTGGPGMGYLFTIPVMIASVIGGFLYSMNPINPWICVLGATVIQTICVIFFIRDPVKIEK
jgi:MFS family permease